MSNLSNMRPVYIGASRKSALAKPRKIRGCINVAMRSATTLAVKAVICPQSDFTTSRASLTRVGRINEECCKTELSRLVGYEALQLNPLARGVVDVTQVPPLFAKDFPRKPFGALRAVGLGATTQGKVFVTIMPEVSAAPYLAAIDGCEVVVDDIRSKGPGPEGVRGTIELPIIALTWPRGLGSCR